MKIRDAWHLVAPQHEAWEEIVANVELSKEGLARFKKEHGRHLIVHLLSRKMSVAFDLAGTWPRSGAPDCKLPEPTGAYDESNPCRKESPKDIEVKVGLAILPEAIDAFERGVDLAGYFEELRSEPNQSKSIAQESRGKTFITQEDCEDGEMPPSEEWQAKALEFYDRVLFADQQNP